MNTLRATPIRLNEDVLREKSDIVQILRVCTFYHDRYGKVDITEKLLSEMVENFKSNARGIDIMIDYEHESQGPAAAWIKELMILGESDKGLFAKVEWTKSGRKRLSDGEFKYLSADFDPAYRDNENPEKNLGAVLLGAALTNRPVIKRMAPVIELSEYTLQNEGEGYMEKEMKEKEMGEKKEMQEPREDKLKQIMKDLDAENVEDLMQIISNMKKKLEEMEGMSTELSELKKEKAMSEKEKKFNKLLSEGKVLEAQREKAMKLSEESFNGFLELAEMNTPVKLSEIGHGHKETKEQEEKKKAPEKDPEDELTEIAVKLSEEKNIPLWEAQSIALSENPELQKKYEEKQGE